ncbi:hypothetical protein YC2023_094571 [Brassica napus]
MVRITLELTRENVTNSRSELKTSQLGLTSSFFICRRSLRVEGTRFGSCTQLISPNHRTGLGYTSRILGGGNRLAVRLCLLTGTRLFERRDEAAGVEIGLCLNKREIDLFVSLFQNGI